MTFGSLFSGIGGFDWGFGQAGLTCSWQVESDAKCNDVLVRHWPDVKRYGDVKDVGKELGAVDLICGGFPCQDVSVAGKREGLAGKQSGLWLEFHRILAELSPSWVVVENVPGLLSSNGGRDFAFILRGLAELGYLSAWRILDAQYFGVAQRRRRVFIVGHLGTGSGAEVLFEREGGAWDSPPGREAGKEVAGSLGGGAGKRGWRDDLDRSGAFVAGFLGGQGAGAGGVGYQREQAPVLKGSPSGTNQVGTIVAFGGNRTSGPIDVAAARNAHGSNRYDFESETFVAWNWQSGGDVRHSFGKPSLHSRQVPAVGVRRLTPTECERLQGFPDGFTDGQSDSARYRQLGNAVCVPVAEWIGRRIKQEQVQMRMEMG